MLILCVCQWSEEEVRGAYAYVLQGLQRVRQLLLTPQLWLLDERLPHDPLYTLPPSHRARRSKQGLTGSRLGVCLLSSLLVRTRRSSPV